MKYEDDEQGQGIDHPNVGAALFEYGHRNSDGSITRFGFEMRVGDNPDFWRARLLMPGAEFLGTCGGAFDTGAFEPEDAWPRFDCRLRAGRTIFVVILPAKDIADCRRRCAEIGGLRPWRDAEPMAMERVRLRIRWLWERRPVIRFRGPLDVFGH